MLSIIDLPIADLQKLLHTENARFSGELQSGASFYSLKQIRLRIREIENEIGQKVKSA